jgi:DNA-binding Xre family transcriptional regulator
MNEKRITIEEIAKLLGVNVKTLVEQYGSSEEVISKFKNGELQVLND